MVENLNNIDDGVDVEIASCLKIGNLRSFFLFAGAGSGKTRSLVKALALLEEEYGNYFRLRRQRVATITYTNAACDEIIHRLDNNPLFFVHTIHSFAWEMIKLHNKDIKDWLRVNLNNEIKTLEIKQAKGRPGTTASATRMQKIESKKNRIQYLNHVKQFVYNPNGDNLTQDSLNHAEVIKIFSFFLTEKSLMQEILIRGFPVLLIDESQDTNKELIEAFFHVQKRHKERFALGLFGDRMQRIYSDGKKELGVNLPLDWATPTKKMNHRCPKRVIKLINKIRENVDGQQQLARSDKQEGFVRLFIVNSDSVRKQEIEREAAIKMAAFTQDDLWKEDDDNIKILTLEHHMAASRMDFLTVFEPIYKVSQYRTSLLDGTLSELRFFTQTILPLVSARKEKDAFKAANIVKRYSLFLDKENLKDSEDQVEKIKEANLAVNDLFALWENNQVPTLLQIVANLLKSRLFIVPDTLRKAYGSNDKSTEDNPKIEAWKSALRSPFTQIENYFNYISNKSRFGTHQGIKGLEFPRVMVILDDSDARGFLFSYEKLFSAKDKSDSDIQKEQKGEETSIDRSKRLLYVTCSRTQESLAVILYTQKPDKVKNFVVSNDWFMEEEIEVLGTV